MSALFGDEHFDSSADHTGLRRRIPLKLEISNIELSMILLTLKRHDNLYIEEKIKCDSLRDEISRHDRTVQQISLSYTPYSRLMHQARLTGYRNETARALIEAMEKESSLFCDRYSDICDVISLLRRRSRLESDLINSIVADICSSSQSSNVDPQMRSKLQTIFTQHLVCTSRSVDAPQDFMHASIATQTCDPNCLDDPLFLDDDLHSLCTRCDHDHQR